MHIQLTHTFIVTLSEQDSALRSPSIRPTSTPASEQWDPSSNLQIGEMSQDVMARLYEISMKEEKVNRA